MIPTLRALLLGLVLVAGLAGCAAGVLVGGTAVGIGLAHDRRTAGTVIEDQAIELKAYGRLSREQSLQGNHINVTSYNTAVLLSGEVATPELRRRAEDIVRNVDKVKRVHNELIIAAPSSLASRSSDAWITTKVKTSLLQIDGLPDFDPTRVKVVTERGIVYLLGLLQPREAEAVISTVRRVGGVQKIVTLFEYIE